MEMNRERGLTLLELVIATVLAIILVSLAMVVSIATIQRGRTRGVAHEIQSMAQLARMEAVSRNRQCLVLLSPEAGQVMVTDGQGTPASNDDILLRETKLPSSIAFQRPDSGNSINWESLGGSPVWFRLVFSPDGTVASGDGDIFLKGDEHYERLSIFVSGSTRIWSWKEGAWQVGG